MITRPAVMMLIRREMAEALKIQRQLRRQRDLNRFGNFFFGIVGFSKNASSSPCTDASSEEEVS